MWSRKASRWTRRPGPCGRPPGPVSASRSTRSKSGNILSNRNYFRGLSMPMAASGIGNAASQSLLRRGEAVIAGGVVSLNRKVEPAIAFVRARGSRIVDADGREYIDYHAAFAPHILGHNAAAVNAAVQRAMEEGWSLMGSGTTPWEVRVAELLRDAVPSLERLQLTNSGSEATAHAIRLSRAWTGRQDVILMLGGYN